MKKYNLRNLTFLTIIAIGLIFGAMFASVQAVYADDGPEGCIAFTSSEAFAVYLGDSNTGKTWDGTVQVSTDGANWEEYTAGDEKSAARSDNGYSVYFRGKNNSHICVNNKDGNTTFRLTKGAISCSGNIENLLDHTKEHPEMSGHAFFELFYGCYNLTTAPELPATTLAAYCYDSMFYGCSGLTKAPELPATTLADHCYASMFDSCTNLTEAPELPATTLADHCYASMFDSCTNLIEAPELPATTLAAHCYKSMFVSCKSLTEAPKLPVITLAAYCYDSMFYGCSSLTEAPELPAMTLSERCYAYMFSGCSSLTEAPELPATTLATACYYQMFDTCTSLTKAPELPATTLADRCYIYMFSGCTNLTVPPALPATAMTDYCYNAMFYGCTSLAEAPELPATQLAERCYLRMFNGCTSLTVPPALPATELARSCYNSMFSDCTSLTEAPELPATQLAERCYLQMFNGCTSLTVPPALPATELAEYCYQGMFNASGVKLSEEKGFFDGVFYGIPYRIPKEGKGTVANDTSLKEMFNNTQGHFTGTPEPNTIYYLATPGWTGSGTEDDPFVISDAIGWNTLMKFVRAGYSMEDLFFKLGDNIEVVEMVGIYEKPFSGSFDGDGNTLTFNADDAPEICAPFVYVRDASFKDLHIAGTIKTKQKFAAGLIGHFDGTVNVTNCRCSITIDSSVNGDGTHGGFIVAGEKDGAACFEGCIFDGQLLGQKTTRCGGFIGWANPTDKQYIIKNCLFAPEELTLNLTLNKEKSFNFIRNAPASTMIQNSYYTKNMENTDDNSQGKAARAVTADKGITVGSADTTVYSVSGITAYDTGLAYGNAFYGEKDDVIPVTIPSVCDEVTANAGTLTSVDTAAGTGTAFTLTMPDQDVHLTLVKGKYHKWKFTGFTWTGDEDNGYTAAVANYECENDPAHKDTVKKVSLDQKVTKPTCLVGGKTAYTATVAAADSLDGKDHSESKDAVATEAAGHQWKEATCTEPRTCIVCHVTEGDAAGHAWGAWTALDGNQHQRVCGNDSTHTEAADHAWDEGVVTKEPTTEETGEKTFTCGVCGATRTEVIPKQEVIPPDDTPVDPDIPVVDTAELKTVGNFVRKEMKIFFHTDTAVTNYQIQYRMAGEADWQVGWSEGTDSYTFRGLDKSSLCEFRIAGYVALEDGSWVRGEWSDISYRYMKSVKLKSAKAGKKRIKLTWAKDKKGNGYQIKYYTDKNIHMADADTISVKGKKKTKYTIRNLQKGQTYYVRIRPVKIRGGIEYIGILKGTKKARVK